MKIFKDFHINLQSAYRSRKFRELSPVRFCLSLRTCLLGGRYGKCLQIVYLLWFPRCRHPHAYHFYKHP